MSTRSNSPSSCDSSVISTFYPTFVFHFHNFIIFKYLMPLQLKQNIRNEIRNITVTELNRVNQNVLFKYNARLLEGGHFQHIIIWGKILYTFYWAKFKYSQWQTLTCSTQPHPTPYPFDRQAATCQKFVFYFAELPLFLSFFFFLSFQKTLTLKENK